jgi:hypothetical protein
MRRFAKENGLSIVFGLLFLGALCGQAIAGHADFNEQALIHGDPQMSLWRYLVSSSFAVDVMENWQSEYLQFTLYAVATVWLFQRGSPESKELDKPGRESDQRQKVGGWAQRNSPAWAKVDGIRRRLYENSILLVMGTIWLGTWLAQSITGLSQYNSDRFDHHLDAVSWWSYVGRPDFWNRTLQNWQSEFLAVGSFVVFAVYLRQRGSSQSKPVGEPHGATGIEG